MKDMNDKNSPYYIRKKIEIGVVAMEVSNKSVKIFIVVILSIYMYGAICLKYVSGAKSLNVALSYTFWSDAEAFQNKIGFDPYYLCLAFFGFFSIYFSFGNIENSKWLQIITMILRFLVTTLMIFGSVYYIAKDGVNEAPVFDFKN